MPEPEIRAVQRIYDAMSQSNIDDLARDVTHDFEMLLPESLPWGGTFHGGEGVRTFMRIFGDHVEGQWADPDEYIGSGDEIVVLGRMRGRGIATGKPFEVHFAHAWTLSDGMPSRCRAYYDTAAIADVLG